MSAWSCPHDLNGICQRVQGAVCDPGMRGCVLHGKVRFASENQNQPRKPVLSKVEGPVLSKVEGPVLSKVEGPVLSKVEGPVLSKVEGAAKAAQSTPSAKAPKRRLPF